MMHGEHAWGGGEALICLDLCGSGNEARARHGRQRRRFNTTWLAQQEPSVMGLDGAAGKRTVRHLPPLLMPTPWDALLAKRVARA
jgi:hypothetical protein